VLDVSISCSSSRPVFKVHGCHVMVVVDGGGVRAKVVPDAAAESSSVDESSPGFSFDNNRGRQAAAGGRSV